MCNPAVSKIAFHASAVFGPRAGLDGNPHDPPGNPPDVPGGFLGVDGSPQSSKLTKPWSLIFFVDCFAFGYVFFSNVPVCVCAFTAKNTSWKGSARFLMGMRTSFRGQAKIKGGYTRFFLNFEKMPFAFAGA